MAPYQLTKFIKESTRNGKISVFETFNLYLWYVHIYYITRASYYNCIQAINMILISRGGLLPHFANTSDTLSLSADTDCYALS